MGKKSKNEKKYKAESSTPKSSPVKESKETKAASASKSETERIKQDQENYKMSILRKIARVYMILFNFLCINIGFTFLLIGMVALSPEMIRRQLHQMIDQQQFTGQNNMDYHQFYDYYNYPNPSNGTYYSNSTYPSNSTYSNNSTYPNNGPYYMDYDSQPEPDNSNSSEVKKAEYKKWVDQMIDIIQDHLGAAPLILVFISILSFVVGIVGCGMTCCNNVKFLKLYLFFSTLALLLFLFGIIILARKYIDFLRITVAGMTFLMQMYGKNQMAMQLVDLVQQQGHCCGAIELTDWQTHVATPGHFDFSYNNSITVGDYPVPGSCCMNVGNVCNFTTAAQNNWNGRQDGMSDIRDMQLHDGDILNEWREQFAQFFKNKTENFRDHVKRGIETKLKKLKTRGQEVNAVIQHNIRNRNRGRMVDYAEDEGNDLSPVDLGLNTNIQVDLDAVDSPFANSAAFDLVNQRSDSPADLTEQNQIFIDELTTYDIGYSDEYYATYESLMMSDARRKIHQKRESEPENNDNDSGIEDVDSEDCMPDYSYESFAEEHRIFGFGCNAKFIRHAERQKSKLIGMIAVMLSPFLLAYVAAIIDSKRIKTEAAAKDLELDN